jgi:transcriptional regulator with XRE-family HTH domain
VGRHQLAADLRRLREDAGLSTYQLADRLGWSQSKVTKIENGRTAPSVDDVRLWAQAANVTGPLDDLLTRAEQALTEAVAWKTALRGGLPQRQQEVAAREAQAGTILYYQPVVVPGPLQTAAYAQQVFTALRPETPTAEVARAVTARMDRQAILFDRSKSLQFVVGEPALRWCYGAVAVQLAQIDRIRQVATLPAVDVAVLPFSRPVPCWHAHGFTLYIDRDDPADAFVMIETVGGTTTLSDPEEVNQCRERFTCLQETALTGDDAFGFLSSLMADLTQA